MAGASALLFVPITAQAVCNINVPTTGQTVICNNAGGTDTLGVLGAIDPLTLARASNVTVNVSGANGLGGISVTGSNGDIRAILLGTNASITNNGFVGITHSGAAGGGFGIFADNATIQNTSTIQSTVSNIAGSVNSRGIDSDRGNITNSGVIRSTQAGLGFSVGVYADTGTLINNQGGVIIGEITSTTSSGQAAGFVNLNGLSATIRNSGSIIGSNAGTGESFAIRGNGIDITNQAGAVIRSTHSGASGNNTGISGNNVVFVNRGSLVSENTLSTSTNQLNSGFSGDRATITNYGVIQSTEAGRGFSTGINSNGGTLTNRAGGQLTSRITNSGNYNTVSGFLGGALNSTVTNYGTVSAQTVGTGRAVGIQIENGRVNNRAGGSVVASTAMSLGVGVGIVTATGGTSDITNAGVIRGDRAAIAYVDGAPGLGVINITNSGTLIGDVRTGSGSDNFTLQHGTNFSVTSTGSRAVADGGTGTNTLALENGTSQTDTSGANFVGWSVVGREAGTWSLTGNISDGGSARSVTHNGTGTLVLSGTNSFTGGVTINSGRIIADSLNSLGNGNVTNISGTLQLGSAVRQTAVVGGAFVQQGGGTTTILLQGGGTSGTFSPSRLNVTGVAQIGGTVNYRPAGGGFLVGQNAVFLRSTGGLTGTFATTTTDSPSAFIRFQTDYALNNQDALVRVVSAGSGESVYSRVAETRNQRVVGRAFDNVARSIGSGSGRDVDNVVGNINVLSADDARRAFDQISGVTHGNVTTLVRGVGQAFMSAIGSRTSLVVSDIPAPAAVPAIGLAGDRTFADDINLYPGNVLSYSSYALDHSDPLAKHLWVRGYGSFGDIDSDRNAEGIDYVNSGVVLGLDKDIDDNSLVGLALGYTNTDAKSDRFDDKAEVNSYELAVYGKTSDLPLDTYLASQLGYLYHDVDISRDIAFGDLDRTARSESTTHSLLTAIEIGRNFYLAGPGQKSTEKAKGDLEIGRILVTPHAGIDYLHQFREHYREKGAGALNLDIDGNDDDSLRVKGGLDAGIILGIGDWDISPSLGIAYAYETLDNSQRFGARLSDVSFSRFTIAAPKISRHYILADFGIAASLADHHWAGGQPSLFLNYGGEYSGDTSVSEVSGGMKLTW